MEPLTPEQARNIPLPCNPLRRSRRVAELMNNHFGASVETLSGGQGFETRRTLVGLAESHERAALVAQSIHDTDVALGSICVNQEQGDNE